jgi:pimeloyl-ACP methyl ester carboxylesterase
MPVEPFTLPQFPEEIADLKARLARTRWLDQVPGTTWEYGFNLSSLQEICRYWQTEFNWQSQVEQLSTFHHFRFASTAGNIHFIHERGKGPNPIPLLITHGWPGSFLEMIKILPMLTDPAAYGGDPNDSFDVVIPSMPGYGFSDRPTAPGMNTFRIAEIWTQLMSELGYDRFAAQGGDIGAGVSTILGLRHADRILGIHLNYLPGSYRPYLAPGTRLTPEEEDSQRRSANWYEQHGAYAHLQRTTPQTAAYGLNDSPAALAAWILEKFRLWADNGPGPESNLTHRFTRDELLTNVTLYWLTQTIHSSFRLYYEGSKAHLHFGPEDFVQVPTAIARFPKEDPFPIRSLVERGYNLQRWTEMPSGGHFAAAEVPALLAEDLRTFFRQFRKK